MNHNGKHATLSAALLLVSGGLLASVASAGAERTATQLHWYRGNTHTHTFNSDGNESPDFVARWYREHGYQFVVITDHDFLTNVEPLNALYAAEGRFLVMRGEEVTQHLADPTHPDGLRQAHVNAINITRVVMPIGDRRNPVPISRMTMAETYQRNIAAIESAGGVAQINHPNWQWSVRLEDLLPVPDPVLLEVWNGITFINNLGGSDDAGNTALSTEALWDALLSRGKMVWGVGVDDSHKYHEFDDPDAARPGQAWVVVRAPELTPDAISKALRRGDFYASTGIALDSYEINGKEIAINIKLPADPHPLLKRVTRYVTRFVGKDGRVLAEVPGLAPRYVVRGGEGYVRASIIDSDGKRAWTQPAFFDGRKTPDSLKHEHE